MTLYINPGSGPLLQWLWTVLAIGFFYIPVPLVLEWQFNQRTRTFWKMIMLLIGTYAVVVAGLMLIEQCFFSLMD